jgi:hypothetical protein
MTALEQPEPNREWRWRSHWSIPAQTADHRPNSAVCGICVRSLRPRGVVHRHQLPICRACAAEPNDSMLLKWWFGVPRQKRREWITFAFGVDPAGYSEADMDTEYGDVVEDTDALLADVKGTKRSQSFGAGELVLPVNTFWNIWAHTHRPTNH